MEDKLNYSYIEAVCSIYRLDKIDLSIPKKLVSHTLAQYSTRFSGVSGPI